MSKLRPIARSTIPILSGRLLRSKRQAAYVRQSDVASLVGIDPSYLSNVEQGRRPVNQDTAFKILDAINRLGEIEKERRRILKPEWKVE